MPSSLSSRTLAALIDGDLALGSRPPQRASQLDPRWQIALFYGGVNGPYGLAPFVGRGSSDIALTNNGATLGTAADGWALQGTIAGTTGVKSLTNFPFNVATNQGSCVVVTRIITVLAATARAMLMISVSTNQFFLGVASSSLFAGWKAGSTDTRVSVSTTGLTTAGINVFSFSWNGGQTLLYVNGVQKASNAVAPATWSTQAASLFLGYNNGANGFGDPIYSETISDRFFDVDEHAYIARNPFNWAFRPSLSKLVLGPSLIHPGTRFLPAFPFGAENGRGLRRRSLILLKGRS